MLQVTGGKLEKSRDAKLRQAGNLPEEIFAHHSDATVCRKDLCHRNELGRRLARLWTIVAEPISLSKPNRLRRDV
jgi:hypothetical protein